MVRQRHPIDMEEDERAGRQLPHPTRQPRRRQVLNLTLYQPRMSGRDYEGPAWMGFSFLYVYVGGEQTPAPRARLKLPIKPKNIKEWERTMTFPMGLGWRGFSVGIEAVREDVCTLRNGRVAVFRTELPHTSGQTAVIGAVRVPLLDALVLGDDDDDDENTAKKRRTETERKLLEGTQVFEEWVQWRTQDLAADEMEEEELAGRQIRLKEEHGVPGRRRVLHLSFARPAMSGRDYEGPAWKPFSSLHVYLGGSKVASLPLPFLGGDVEAWWRPFELPMEWQWPCLCLCLEAVREDYVVDEHTGRVSVFRTEEPHTSGQTAVIGAAMVPLLDALVLGDDDDGSEEEEEEEEEVEKKRRLERELNLAKGTQVFQERVKLQGWRQGDTGEESTNVVSGSVVVLLYMSEYEDEEDDDDGTGW